MNRSSNPTFQHPGRAALTNSARHFTSQPAASSDDKNETNEAETHDSFFQRRIITPLLDLLRVGCSPRRLAWSLAAGLVIGINPLLGSTTLASLLLAWALRLNLVASQIANHIVYPLQLLLFLFFIRIGDKIFHTGRLPLEGHALFHAARVHPWATTRELWRWEWHALIVWAALAAIVCPLLAAMLTPVLRRLHEKLHREHVPA